MSKESQQKYFAGCDVGSTTGKAVILDHQNILASAVVPSEIDPELTAKKVLQKAFEQVPSLKDFDDFHNCSYLVGTGYGRNEIPFANQNMSEIACHGQGVFSVNPESLFHSVDSS